MQRAAEHLHRTTPIPSLEPLGSRRTSGALSVSSIAEEDEREEHDSATSLVSSAEKLAPRVGGKPSKLSSIPSGKPVTGKNNGFVIEEAVPSRPLAGLRYFHTKRGNNSGPPSPTVSEDSEGSGATFRSAESLHRPTPIPQEASSSYTVPGSFSRRSGGRLVPTTPTINEFDDNNFSEAEPAVADGVALLLASKEPSRKGSGTLHRPTPIPGDLLSSAGSQGRAGHRPATPTIHEDEHIERASEADSVEHFYGAHQQLADDGGSLYATPRETQEPPSRPLSSGSATPASIKLSSPEPQLPEADVPLLHPHAGAPTPVVESSNAEGAGRVITPVATANPAVSLPASPSFSPFVESKDWERDILGVARFLRMCPGLSRQIIGDLLGENNERCLRVLECFTASFDFRGLTFEAALREYLESFRLPGEAQKIYRILDAWSRQFFQHSPGIFKNGDAVHVLAFSLVLLNTDRHNSTVKRKMGCDEFVRNNKGLNGGEDFPREFLEELFNNIARRAIRIPAAHSPDTNTPLNSLPEPIRATQERYISPAKARKPGFFSCF